MGNGLISTRKTFGETLTKLGEKNKKIVVVDAEVSNSTCTNLFGQKFPERFFQMYIAEQNAVSVALGLSKVGFIPFFSTFAAFLTRAFDQIRMAQYSTPNLKIVGSHCGVSIGADGPSQMGLEDIAMMRSILNSIVFYPSDAVSTEKLTEIMAETQGMFYLRTTRGETPIIYDANEKFVIGGSKTHYPKSQTPKIKIQKSTAKYHALIISAGITLHEALKAHKQLAEKGINTVVMDCYSIKPLDEKTIQQLANQTDHIIVVEDHYPAGGLGEAVLSLLGQLETRSIRNFDHLCVKKTPRSGTTEELLAYEEIDTNAIVKVVFR